jgi:hypothetical protein
MKLSEIPYSRVILIIHILKTLTYTSLHSTNADKQVS